MSLHVAVQMGPSLHPKHARMSDVWPLRIPLAFLRSAFPADCPHLSRCHHVVVAQDPRRFQQTVGFL